MTTTTGDPVLTPPRSPLARRRGASLRTAGWLVRSQGRTVLGSAGVLAVLLLGTLLIGLRLGGIDNAVVPYARQALIWFPFSMAVIVVTAVLPVHVAGGQTRLALARGSLLAGAVLGVVYASLLTAGLVLERVMFGLLDWPHRFTEPGLAGPAGDAWLFLLDHGLTCVAAQVAGLLVGIVYYRTGGWWGTLALPLTLAPILLTQGLLTWDVVDWDLPVEVLAGVLVIVAAAAVYTAVLRRTPVRTTTAS